MRRGILITLSLLSLFSLAASSLTPEEISLLQAKSKNLEAEQCDIVVDKGICLYKGNKLVFPDAKVRGLVGYWNFDDFKGTDSSGYHLHINENIPSGPGFGGQGYSAKIGGRKYLAIPPAKELDDPVFSISFWFFWTKVDAEASGLRWCPILFKGNEKIVDEEREQVRSPGIFLDRMDRIVKVYLTTTKNGVKTQGDVLKSVSRVPYNKWTHIAVVKQEQKVRLYINGILDSVIVIKGSSVANNSPLYIGNHPDYVHQCDINGYIDELKFYRRTLSESEIQAEGSAAFGMLDSSAVHLGCIDCDVITAKKSCYEGYHLCTSMELHSIAYQVAKTQGWVEWNPNIWTYNAYVLASKDLPDEDGLHPKIVDGELEKLKEDGSGTLNAEGGEEQAQDQAQGDEGEQKADDNQENGEANEKEEKEEKEEEEEEEEESRGQDQDNSDEQLGENKADKPYDEFDPDFFPSQGLGICCRN